MGKIDKKAFDKAISHAAEAAAFLKETDPRFKTVNPRIAFHIGLLDEKPRYITMACTGPKDDSFEVLVVSKKQAKEMIERFTECVALMDDDEEEATENQMTIYKEMKYQMRLSEAETLADGQEGPYKWKVLSLGTHPCGYVAIPKGHPFYGKDYCDIEDKIEVHGGITFGGKLRNFEGRWIGWDYAHAGDYTYLPIYVDVGDKRWTTKEIVDECLNVIKQLRSYEEK